MVSCEKPISNETQTGNTELFTPVLNYFSICKEGSYYIFENQSNGLLDSIVVKSYIYTKYNNCGSDVFPSLIKHTLYSNSNPNINSFYITHSTDCKNLYNYVNIARSNSGIGGDIYYTNSAGFYPKNSNVTIIEMDSFNGRYIKFPKTIKISGNFDIYFANSIGICQFILNGDTWVLKKYFIKR